MIEYTKPADTLAMEEAFEKENEFYEWPSDDFRSGHLNSFAAGWFAKTRSMLAAAVPVAWGTLLAGGKLHAHRNSKNEADRRTGVWNTRVPRRCNAVTVPLFLHPVVPLSAANMRARAEEESAEDAAVIHKLATILAGVCVALKGEELPLHRHSYHDIVEVAQTIKLELDLYRMQAASATQFKDTTVGNEAFASRCWCETCRPVTMHDSRMVVCPDCGNKRCPKATNHENACTGSNEPGQKGSSWENFPLTAHSAPVRAEFIAAKEA